jgi:hypothetical protein
MGVDAPAKRIDNLFALARRCQAACTTGCQRTRGMDFGRRDCLEPICGNVQVPEPVADHVHDVTRGLGHARHVLEYNTQRNDIMWQGAGELGVIHDQPGHFLLVSGQKDDGINAVSGHDAVLEILEKLTRRFLGNGTDDC